MPSPRNCCDEAEPACGEDYRSSDIDDSFSVDGSDPFNWITNDDAIVGGELRLYGREAQGNPPGGRAIGKHYNSRSVGATGIAYRNVYDIYWRLNDQPSRTGGIFPIPTIAGVADIWNTGYRFETRWLDGGASAPTSNRVAWGREGEQPPIGNWVELGVSQDIHKLTVEFVVSESQIATANYYLDDVLQGTKNVGVGGNPVIRPWCLVYDIRTTFVDSLMLFQTPAYSLFIDRAVMTLTE